MVSKKSIAFVTQDGTFNDAAHVAPRSYFSGRNLNLVAVAVGIGNGGAVNHAIETRPKCGAHAHWAGLAGGVKRVAGQRDLLEPPSGEANRAHLCVSAWITLLSDGIQRAQKLFSRSRVNDRSAKGARSRSAQGSSGKSG